MPSDPPPAAAPEMKELVALIAKASPAMQAAINYAIRVNRPGEYLVDPKHARGALRQASVRTAQLIGPGSLQCNVDNALHVVDAALAGGAK